MEAAAHFAHGQISPFVQYATKNFDLGALADQRYWQAGLAYWMAGHQRNLKVSAGRQHTTGLADRTQVLAQMQIFFF